MDMDCPFQIFLSFWECLCPGCPNAFRVRVGLAAPDSVETGLSFGVCASLSGALRVVPAPTLERIRVFAGRPQTGLTDIISRQSVRCDQSGRLNPVIVRD